VLADGPVLREVRDDTELFIELDESGEDVGQQLAGDRAEVDLRRVQGRDLADAVAPPELAALLDILPAREASWLATGCDPGRHMRQTDGVGGGTARGCHLHEGTSTHSGPAENTPVDQVTTVHVSLLWRMPGGIQGKTMAGNVPMTGSLAWSYVHVNNHHGPPTGARAN